MAEGYCRRIVDDLLDDLLAEIAAVALEGPKAVGKTASATQRAATVFPLDQELRREAFLNADRPLEHAAPPILLDEWHYVPPVWNDVRRLVDGGAEPGRFLLTGSAAPRTTPIHSGAGRIVRVRLRPLSLAERALDTPVVSMADALGGKLSQVQGSTTLTFEDYAREIARSGFPALHRLSPRARAHQLRAYLDNIVNREFEEQGLRVRRPDTLHRWLRAYASATATTASYSAILDAATPGEGNKPSAVTTIAYRDVLAKLWMLDPVPAWDPAGTSITRVGRTPKHYLADPALAALLLGLDEETLLGGPPEPAFGPRYGSITGRLFEALIALSLQTYAAASDAAVSYLRTRSGAHEVDFIVQQGQRLVAIEVKLAPSVTDADVRHLVWLRDQVGPGLREAIIVTTGPNAYRRKSDGVVVVPAGLLGP
jgi:hypothetical protein